MQGAKFFLLIRNGFGALCATHIPQGNTLWTLLGFFKDIR